MAPVGLAWLVWLLSAVASNLVIADCSAASRQ